ncbi:conserved Plasmodium protein, unknown function [Plasmodium malariae]|uniref:Serpentine receptor n=1 Tax=Plasmodium malariae TaxID=5858 RepID=A0A1C3L1N0_PLAMA|nr:conserved Plasmodium protein, unknown function [Plasmodium malariae]
MKVVLLSLLLLQHIRTCHQTIFVLFFNSLLNVKFSNILPFGVTEKDCSHASSNLQFDENFVYKENGCIELFNSIKKGKTEREKKEERKKKKKSFELIFYYIPTYKDQVLNAGNCASNMGIKYPDIKIKENNIEKLASLSDIIPYSTSNNNSNNHSNNNSNKHNSNKHNSNYSNDKKKGVSDVSHVSPNKKALLIFDNLKKQMTYVIISYCFAKEQTVYPVNIAEYNAYLKGVLYTHSYMKQGYTIYQSGINEYYNREEYLKDGMDIYFLSTNKLEKKEDMCYYNYYDDFVDPFKNAFLRRCKTENGNTFEKNIFFKNANERIKNFFTNEERKKGEKEQFPNGRNDTEKKDQVKEVEKEKQVESVKEAGMDVEVQKAKEIGYFYHMHSNYFSKSAERNSNSGSSTTPYDKNTNVRTKWNDVGKYIYLTYLKGVHILNFYTFPIFSVYTNLFYKNKAIPPEQMYEDTFIYEQSNVNCKIEVGTNCSCKNNEHGANNIEDSSSIHSATPPVCNSNNSFIYNLVEKNNINSFRHVDVQNNKSIYYYYFINYNNKSYLFEVNTNSQFSGDIFMNGGEILYRFISESEKELLNNRRKYVKDGNTFTIYIDEMSTNNIYKENCRKFNTIKWALILFFIPAWLIINVVYLILVQNIWRQIFNPLHRFLISPSLIRLSSYIMLLMFCIMQCPYRNSRCVEYFILGYMALNTMFNTIFFGNLLLISKGYMITRGNFNKRESLYLTLIISFIYILTSFSHLNIMNEALILICLHTILFLLLVTNILSIIKFLKLKLSFVRNFGLREWEQSIHIKLSMYKVYLCLIIFFFSFERILQILKVLFNFLSANITLIEYTIELITWCSVLYIFRYRGDILYFSLLYDNITFNIIPLYIVKNAPMDHICDKERNKAFDDFKFPIFILNPLEYSEQNFLSRMAIGWPIYSHYEKKCI